MSLDLFYCNNLHLTRTNLARSPRSPRAQRPPESKPPPRPDGRAEVVGEGAAQKRFSLRNAGPEDDGALAALAHGFRDRGPTRGFRCSSPRTRPRRRRRGGGADGAEQGGAAASGEDGGGADGGFRREGEGDPRRERRVR